MAMKYKRELAGKYDTLEVKIFDINRVSQINNALSEGEKIVKFSIIGHANSKKLQLDMNRIPILKSHGGGEQMTLILTC